MSASSYPPGPKGIPLIGNIYRLFEFMHDPVGFFFKVAEKYGDDDIVYFKVGPRRVYLLNNPEYIQDVLTNHYGNFVKGAAWERGKGILGEGLLTSEGNFHKRQRRLAQPAFHQHRIASYGALMIDCAEKTQDKWQDGSILDLYQEMYRLTLSIVAKTLFGAEIESETKDISNALSVVREEWLRTIYLTNLPLHKLIMKLPLSTFRRFNKARNRLDATIYRIIKDRRASGKDYGDLLSMLLLSQDEDCNGDGMTDLQVRDEVMTIFLAGHETTASSLIWVLYLISQNPEVEARLWQELDKVLPGRIPMVEDLPHLQYTRMVFAETLRIYPPVWLTTRRPLKDWKVGSYTVPADSVIVICPYLIHRNPRFYPNPLCFDPQRWTAESEANRPRFAYLPFGGGPRRCLGEHFAWMESALVIATIAQRWRLESVPGHPVEPELYVTLRPKYGMKMKLERRN